ncbi:MAG: sugar ABC transporter ATP-binding protein [Flexilinea sp.]
MEIRKGEVVGLIGENGAGKSTLMKIIAGVEQPSNGTMMMNGKPYTPKSVIEANNCGVGMVFQEQSLILNLTVAQNIFLGREKPYCKGGIINWKKMSIDAKNALKRLDIEDTSPNKKINDLNFVTRQMVEIAKMLDVISSKKLNNAILLLDEPTTVLSKNEIDILYEEIRNIKAKGVSVIFISHRLDEVLEISDRIYVFKDGEGVGVVETKDANSEMLYELMVGRISAGEYYFLQQQTIPGNDIVLEVKELSKFGYFKNISFRLKKGEILGLCGVEGSGKEEVCAVLCGDEDYSAGEIIVNGDRIRNFKSPTAALSKGILSIPKDRKEEGIIGMLSVSDNIIASGLKSISRYGVLSPKKIKRISKFWVEKMGIKCNSINERVSRLSGGNAQKVIFSRVISSDCEILTLNHPTRGVDIGAKEDLYKTIREMTNHDKSVILLGDTLDECIGLSSHIIVMKDGEMQKEFECSAESKPAQVEIVKYMM